ncbi:MAG: hypothetical protein RQ724_11040, partial [Desulfuromonadales bacterium]|nr:hypothetical protein [Desulfuromonadales bacterium]
TWHSYHWSANGVNITTGSEVVKGGQGENNGVKCETSGLCAVGRKERREGGVCRRSWRIKDGLQDVNVTLRL